MSPIGVDLLDVERLERALARHPGLEARLFTEAERSYAATRPRPGPHLAARFCAKEAVTKALSLEVLRPQEIEVVGGGGPPLVALHGAAAARARELGVEVEVSLTHTARDAAAVVLAA